jgi:hypothetical protein
MMMENKVTEMAYAISKGEGTLIDYGTLSLSDADSTVFDTFDQQLNDGATFILGRKQEYPETGE